MAFFHNGLWLLSVWSLRNFPLAIAATTASDTAVSSVWLLNVSPYMTPGRITSSGTRPNFFIP